MGGIVRGRRERMAASAPAVTMDDQWQNFLCNLGEWRGSFTSLSRRGEALESTPSILSLEQGAEERLVHFRLRRFGPDGFDGEPQRDHRQDYRSLGRQVVFFSTGSFCKGTLQVAPGTAFGGEFGFVEGDRRHRLVQLHDDEGQLDGLVLIREVRTGSDAGERPPLSAEQLCGTWRGEAETINADWPVPDRSEATLVVAGSGSEGWRFERRIGAVVEPASPGAEQVLLLPDGGYHRTPLQVSHRSPFAVEAGWMPAHGRLECLVRRFDASGAWLSSTQLRLAAG